MMIMIFQQNSANLLRDSQIICEGGEMGTKLMIDDDRCVASCGTCGPAPVRMKITSDVKQHLWATELVKFVPRQNKASS